MEEGLDTILLQKMFAHFNVQDPQALIQKIYGSTSPKNEISSLSKIVFEAYHEKDLQAEGIILHAVKEITDNITTLY